MHSSETETINTLGKTDAQVSRAQQPSSSAKISEKPVNMINSIEKSTVISANVILPSEATISSEEKTHLFIGKSSEITLLDQGSLLRCIVRTIPPNGRIRISSTLPNRLGKMLSPLHWHDYKKSYGKLDDFVAGHPELFVIEGDYIQLREGAQEIIVATAAFAKVKAAAFATLSNSSLFPSVVVTPMAQQHRLKREHPTSRPGNLTDGHSQIYVYVFVSNNKSSTLYMQAIGYDFDYDDYYSFVHGRLPYENLKPDPVLRSLLLSLPIHKVVHAVKALSRLGLEDCFEGINCFETLNPVYKSAASDDEDDIQFTGLKSYSSMTTCKNEIFDIVKHFSQPNASTSVLLKTTIVCKPSEHAIEKALKIGNINARRTVRFTLGS